MEIDFIVMPGKLLKPSLPHDVEVVEKWGLGEVVRADVRRPRNAKFHRKFMALMQAGFEAWEPDNLEYKGQTAQKNFDRFRKDVTIACGYYELVTNIKGEVRAEAKSIAFANMDEDEFSKLYNTAIDFLLQYVMKNYTREDVENVTRGILDFA